MYKKWQDDDLGDIVAIDDDTVTLRCYKCGAILRMAVINNCWTLFCPDYSSQPDGLRSLVQINRIALRGMRIVGEETDHCLMATAMHTAFFPKGHIPDVGHLMLGDAMIPTAFRGRMCVEFKDNHVNNA